MLAIPLARGGLPGGLAFARSWYAPAVAAQAAPTPAATPTLVASTVAQSLGALAVSAPVCQAAQDTFQLRNGGRTPVAWAAGAPLASESVTFRTTPSGAAQSALLGTLVTGGVLTIYATTPTASPYRVVIFAAGGAIPLVAPAC